MQDTLLNPTEFAPPSTRINSQTWLLQAPPDPTWLVQLMPTHQRRRRGFGNLPRSLRITSPLIPAPLNSICNLNLPAGIPARTSPPRGGAGFQPTAPADKQREKAATVRENFGERLLETASDKEGIVRQMERNSARSQPGPIRAAGTSEPPLNSSVKVQRSRGKRWDGAQPRRGPAPGAAPRRSIRSIPGLWLGALRFSSFGKKEKKKKRNPTRLLSQTAAAEYSLTYFFSSPPFILTYFGAAAAAASRSRGALPSALLWG